MTRRTHPDIIRESQGHHFSIRDGLFVASFHSHAPTPDLAAQEFADILRQLADAVESPRKRAVLKRRWPESTVAAPEPVPSPAPRAAVVAAPPTPVPTPLLLPVDEDEDDAVYVDRDRAAALLGLDAVPPELKPNFGNRWGLSYVIAYRERLRRDKDPRD
jgi:hypothetical protein